MSITAKFLKDILTEAKPVIERQMNDAKIVAGFRDVVASNGGDWGALKALIKAHVEDDNDETGEGKRVQKILDKADSTSAYADMLGLANMNEKNYFAETAADRSDNGANISMRHSGIATDLPPHDAETGEISDDDAFAAVTAESQLADTMGVEPSPSEPNSVHVGDERTEQPEDGLSASGDNSEIEHSAPSSQVAASAGEANPPASSAVFSSPAAVSPRVDDGQPDQSSDEVPSGQGGDKPRLYSGQSGQQTASAAQDRNEPVSASGASATISEAEVPAFLKRKDGCLDQAGCKVKTYSILCARCAAERVRARAA